MRTYLRRFDVLAQWRPVDIENWTLDGGARLESLARIEAEESEEKIADPLTAGTNFGERHLEV